MIDQLSSLFFLYLLKYECVFLSIKIWPIMDYCMDSLTIIVFCLTFNLTLEDQVNYLLQLHSLKISYGLDVETGLGVRWVDWLENKPFQNFRTKRRGESSSLGLGCLDYICDEFTGGGAALSFFLLLCSRGTIVICISQRMWRYLQLVE